MPDLPRAEDDSPTDRLDANEQRWAVRRWELEVELARSRHQRDLAEWRERCLRERRGWRMLEVVSAARRSPRGWIRLPSELLRVATDRRDPPPAPSPPRLPERPIPAPPSAAAAVRRAKDALRAGRSEDALEAANEALATDPGDVRALDAAWRALDALGEITRAIAVLRRQREIQDRSWLALAERRLQGTLIGLDPRWMPAVTPLVPSAGGPVLVIGLGDLLHRGPDAVEHDPPLVGIPVDVELGPTYGFGDLPLDVAIRDLAWWATRSARGRHPRLIAAPLSTTDLRPAIAGLAIGRASGLRVTVVLDPGAQQRSGASEHAQLERQRYRQLLEAVDGTVSEQDLAISFSRPGGR